MMSIYYVNSQGVLLNLLNPPYMLQTGTLFDKRWEYQSKSTMMGKERIIGFSRNIDEKTLTMSIVNDGKHEYYNAINYFVESTEIDVIHGSPGKLYVGDMYLKCYVVSSEKADWESGEGFLDNEITLISDSVWTQEHAYIFKASEVASTNNRCYGYRYPYRYANGFNNTAIENIHYAECNFCMYIYGPCVKPSVYIGGNEYSINVILEEGEYLEINSREETLYKVMRTGLRVNAFNNRSFVNSVFRPIQTGRQEVFWNGKFDFDLILFEERSEPKWQ